MRRIGAAILIVLACSAAYGAGPTMLVEFSATWCGPCQSMRPAVRQLEADGVPLRRVDIDGEPKIAAAFGVNQIPCFVAMVDGREVARRTGSTSLASLRQFVSRAGIKAK